MGGGQRRYGASVHNPPSSWIQAADLTAMASATACEPEAHFTDEVG
jgi:hypothetical protein